MDEYIVSLFIVHFERSCNDFTFFLKQIDLLRLLEKQNLFGFLLGRYKSYVRQLYKAKGIKSITEPYDRFGIAFKTGEFRNVVQQWIEENPIRPPEEMAKIVQKFLEKGITSFCAKFAK